MISSETPASPKNFRHARSQRDNALGRRWEFGGRRKLDRLKIMIDNTTPYFFMDKTCSVIPERFYRI
jgi:hypothetical protein